MVRARTTASAMNTTTTVCCCLNYAVPSILVSASLDSLVLVAVVNTIAVLAVDLVLSGSG